MFHMKMGGEQNISLLRQVELKKREKVAGSHLVPAVSLISSFPSLEGKQKKRKLLILTSVGVPIPSATVEAPGRENGCPYRYVQNQVHDLLPQTWSSSRIHCLSDGDNFPPRANTRSLAVGMAHVPC